MKRALLNILAALLLVLTSATGGAFYLINSRDGLEHTLRLGATLLPGTLTVGGVEGRLRGPLILEALEYRDAHRQIRLDRLELTWQPEALLARTVYINALTLRGLSIVQTADAPAGEPIKLDLPFGVIVEQLNAEHLSYQSGDRPPQQIERITLNARLDQTRFNIAAFELLAPQGELRASGTLQARGRYRVDLDTAWRLALPGQPELRGGGKLQGTLRRLTSVQSLHEPLALTVEATVENLVGKNPGWSLRASAPSLDLRPWIDAPIDPLRDVALQLQGSTSAFQGEASLAYTLPELGAVQLRTELAGSARELVLRNLQLTPASNTLRAHLNARIDLTTVPPTAAVTGNWENLQWPLQGVQQIASPKGTFELTGHAQDYRLQVQAPLQLPNAALGEWRISGHGDRTELRLERIAGRVANGTIEGSGRLAWQNTLRWEANVTAAELDPAVYAAEWPGQLGATVKASGAVDNGKPTAAIELTTLSGTLRGYPAQATAQVEITAEGVRVRKAQLQSGTARIALDGRIAEQLDLAFQLDAAALQELLPVSGGRVKASGRLRGTPGAPRLDATLQLADLALEATTLRSAQGEINADLAPGGAIKARLVAETLALGHQTLDQITLTAAGRTENHELQLAAQGAQGEFAATLRGGYRDQRWRGALSRGSWQQTTLGAWVLTQPAVLEIGAAAAQLAAHCWRQQMTSAATPPGSMCLGGDWARDGAWQIKGSAEHLPLSLLNPLLPDGASVTGPLSGKFQLQQAVQGAVNGSAQLNLDPGSLHPGRGAADAQTLTHQGGEIELTLAADRLAGRLALSLAAEGTLSGRVALQPFDLGQPTATQTGLSGELQLRLPDLNLFTALLPRLAIGPGSVETKLVLSGRIGAPQLRGSASLQAEQIEVGSAGITLKDLHISGESADGRRWKLAGSTTSGGGQLTVEGAADLDPARGWPLRLKIHGERFEAVDLSDYRALVSPNLTLTLEQQRLTVEGDLRVPEAQIRPRRGGNEAVAVSRDAVIIGAEIPESRSPLQALYARINLILGDKVEFTGFGLSSRITGQLAIEDAPDSVVKGNGELRVVQGKYKSYGQNLEVESGRLTFAGGPIDNPGIDARAVRRSGDVTAGILLRGTLRNPQVTLFSTPSLPQADILSYLVLGVPINQADQQSGGSSLLATAAALGYVADSPVVRQIRRGLGIEELRIESDTTRESVAVVLGSYLSPRLYVSYSVGLTESDSAFRIRYKVGRNWTLETESGTQSGADLRYVIEK